MWKIFRSKQKSGRTILQEQLEVAEFLGSVKQRLIDAGGCVDHVEEIVAGEHALALEDILCNVHECDICLTKSEFERVKEFAQSLDLDPCYWNELRVQEL